MRRLRAFVASGGVVAVLVLVMASTAAAFTLPANAGAAPGSSVASYCPAYPADPTQPGAGDEALLSGGVSVSGSGWTAGASVAVAAGTYEVSQGQPGWASAFWELQSQDSAGTWVTVASGSGLGSSYVYVPAGPARFDVYNTTASTVAMELVAVPVAGDLGNGAQYAEVACLNQAAAANAAHADSAAVLGELQTLDADLRANGGSGTATTVGLDSESQAFIDAEFAGVHVDLWILMGAVVGAFGVGILVSRLWI